MTKLKNLNVTKLKTKNVTKLKTQNREKKIENSKCDKTQKLKM